MEYITFASKLSFYEFLQDEFKKPHFDTGNYKKEIDILKSNINIDYITKSLESNPKIIDIFEELLQLKRFTNTQYINFCFDVNVLNNAEESLQLKYMLNSVFKFENGQANDNFADIYCNLCVKNSPTREELIFFTKRAMVKYIDKVIKKRNIFYHHISNSISCRLRISKYLIENMNADQLLSTVDLEKFLSEKRHPVDGKYLHGNFGNIKISGILDDYGFKDITDRMPVRILSLKSILQEENSFKGLSYIRERAIEGINKRKDRKPKKFDYILLQNGKPKILIETNFYSTSGTKIGINQGEYVDLHEDIKEFNRSNNAALNFMWITDGNYWLSKDGENRFTNLKKNYFKGDFELLNYNLFKHTLSKIKDTIM